MTSKKPLTMKENPDVKKLFSDPSGQIKLPVNASLYRYGRISLQRHGIKRSHGGTKSSGSGKPAVANRM
jgi:hypothetical protein